MPSHPHTTSRLGWPQRIARGARMALYLGVVAALLGAWSIRQVLAQAEVAFASIDDSFARDLGPGATGQVEAFTINGQPLLFATRQSELGVHDVLQTLERACRGDAHGSMLDNLPATSAPSRETALVELLAAARRFGVLRSEDGDHGSLLCFARVPERAGLRALAEDVRALSESGDLARLGDLRYVRARREPNGRTLVSAVWTQGPFKLGALFPDAGDAPGDDMDGVPRPPQARRELAARSAGHGYGLRLYASAAAPEALLAFYSDSLPTRGWSPVGLPADGALGGGLWAQAYVRNGHGLAISVEAPRGEPTRVSLIDLGSVTRSVPALGAGVR